MTPFNNYDIDVLLLRLGIAFLYLYAAYMNSRNKASIQWSIDNTRVLFAGSKWAKNESIVKTATYVAIALMYIGGLSVLIGLEARIGALMLAVFTATGTLIHRRQQMEAQAVALASTGNPDAARMGWSAFSAHFANILKNVALVLILLFVFFYGAGAYALTDYFFTLISK